MDSSSSRWRRASALALAAPLLAGCTTTHDAADGEPDPAGVTSGGVSSCPAMLPDEGSLTWEQPFGVVNEDCEVVPYVNPAESVDCASVWQVGARLPEDYRGCDTPAWPWCDDPGLQDAWTYQDMYAAPGEVIVRGELRGSDSSPC